MHKRVMWAICVATIALGMVSRPTIAGPAILAPMVAGCPTPSPPTWPIASSCRYQFYPLTDASHAIASGSKSAPQYLHTLGGYPNKATLVLACPINATLSIDNRQCLDVTGKDASALVPISALSTFSIAAPPPAGPDYSQINGYLIEQSYDAGITWDAFSTTVLYPTQTSAHCFRITAQRIDGGKGPSMVSCPLPQ